MARPRKTEKEKRKLVSVRFDPDVRTAFELAATQSGRSVAGEVEYRATALAHLDSRTVDFIREIAAQIVALEERHPTFDKANPQRRVRKSWHGDLRIWSAVAEMLARGPIKDWKPSNEIDKEAQEEAWKPLGHIVDEQFNLVTRLADLGITVMTDERKFGGTGRGLLGGSQFSSRTTERAAIEAIPDDDVRAAATQLHDRLRELDVEVGAARAKWVEEMQPYWDQEAQGRQDYRDHLHETAVRRREAGEPFSYAHLMKWFV